MSGADQKSAVRQSPGAKKKWVCGVCSASNPQLFLLCRLCNTQKCAPDKMGSSSSENANLDTLMALGVCSDRDRCLSVLIECDNNVQDAADELLSKAANQESQSASSTPTRKRKRVLIPRKPQLPPRPTGSKARPNRSQVASSSSASPSPVRRRRIPQTPIATPSARDMQSKMKKLRAVTGEENEDLLRNALTSCGFDVNAAGNFLFETPLERREAQIRRSVAERRRAKVGAMARAAQDASSRNADERERRQRGRDFKKRRRLVSRGSQVEEQDDTKNKSSRKSIDLTEAPELPELPPEAEGEDALSDGSSSEYDDEDSDVDRDAVVQSIVSRCTDLGRRISRGCDEASDAEAESRVRVLGRDGQYRLKDFQMRGVQWLWRLYDLDVNGVLADEMGLGKTIQTVALILLITESDRQRHRRPFLVVAPTSVLDNWVREFSKFAPSLRVLKYHGSVRERMAMQMDCVDPQGGMYYDVLITGYTLFEKSSGRDDRAWLRRIQFEYLVLDEGHSIKNLKGQRFENLARLKVLHKLILSGTPIQNNMMELLSLLRFLMPNLFQNQVLLDLAVEGDTTYGVGVFRSLLEPFCLRRVKDTVLKEIGPKHDSTLLIGLPGGQRNAYDALVESYRHDRRLRSATHAFTQLRKAANHPLLLRRHYTDEMMREIAKLIVTSATISIQCKDPLRKAFQLLSKMSDFRIHEWCAEESSSVPKLADYMLTSSRFGRVRLTESGKFDQLRDLLPKLRAQGHRALVFSQWTNLLDIMELLMEELGMEYTRLDGSTPAAERQSRVDRFNRDEKLSVFLLSTRSGGVGLNLTSADTVILHDLDFNPQNDIQAENRCHRIGQKKPVTVYRLVAKDTVDERIFQIAQKKKALNQAVLLPCEADSDFAKSIMKDILSRGKSEAAS